eukprot:1581426-Rhodomonas_salina.2
METDFPCGLLGLVRVFSCPSLSQSEGHKFLQKLWVESWGSATMIAAASMPLALALASHCRQRGLCCLRVGHDPHQAADTEPWLCCQWNVMSASTFIGKLPHPPV